MKREYKTERKEIYRLYFIKSSKSHLILYSDVL